MGVARKGQQSSLKSMMGNDAAAVTTSESSDVKMKQEGEVLSSSKPAADALKDEDESKDDEEEEKSDDEDEETKKKREAELKEKYKDWPLRGIKDPHDNDVMYGRGGGTNHHTGNKRYRKMVEDRKLEYVNSKRLDKPLVALEIIRVWRAQLPPGRFLKLDEKTGLWNDVGDKKAREKTSQALREKAPMIRKQQEEDDETVDDEEKAEDVKVTRFAEGTKKEDASQVKKAVLARDHSLGREYIEAGQAVSLDGFSWQDPFQAKSKESTYGRPTAPPTAYPAGRNSSHGSLGMAPPHHITSVGVPPPPPDYWGRVNSAERQREFSNGRYESWGSTTYGYLAPPPPPPGHVIHQRSGSWTHGPPPPPGRYVHQRSGSWGSERENSLGVFPLIGASIAGPADRGAFDSGRSGSGYWGDAPMAGSSSRSILPSSPPPPGYVGGPMRSSGSLGPYRQPLSPTNSTPSPKLHSVDLTIAKTWSGGEVQRTWSGEHEPTVQQAPSYDGFRAPISGAEYGTMQGSEGYVPKPQIVKRDTSHQNENYETKPSVKRAALNRDNSLASNRLKHEYMPEFFDKKFDAEQEMRSLSSNLEQSTLDTDRPKPQPLSLSERISTIEAIAMDFLVKPAPIFKDDRVSTIDALDLDLDEDHLINSDESTIPLEDLPKPRSLGPVDRLTTNDFIDLVNSPIAQVDGGAPQDDSDDPLPLNQERISDDWLTQV